MSELSAAFSARKQIMLRWSRKIVCGKTPNQKRRNITGNST
jgi:hypothetical protein